MRKVFFVSAQEQETCRKNIKGQGTLLPGREKTGETLPIRDPVLNIVAALFEQNVVAPNKKFVLQGLFGIGHLGTRMFDEVLHLGGKTYINAQYPFEKLFGHISEPIGDLVGKYQ